MEPIVHKLKRLVREKEISQVTIAEKLGKHRTFITRKLGGDSMETRLLEDILRATGITYDELFCNSRDSSLKQEIDALREEVNMIKEHLPNYQSGNKT